MRATREQEYESTRLRVFPVGLSSLGFFIDLPGVDPAVGGLDVGDVEPDVVLQGVEVLILADD